jgi:hypothetical protein
MGVFRHKRYAICFKAVFAILYAILLGSQLSVKFYLCANSPTGAGGAAHCPGICGKQPNSSLTAHVVHRTYVSYSLDKRYHFKHVFALSNPVFSCPSHLLSYKAEVSVRERIFVDFCALINPRRGPPSA